MIAPMAQENGVTVVLEHLNQTECNIVTDLVEEIAIVQRVGHPAFSALLDTYHFWADGLPMWQAEQVAPYVRHVHLADKDGRVPPGESKTADYRPIFAILKKAGYSGGLSVEASGFGDIAVTGPRVLAFLKQQWQEA
jgi:sugar phosphate isomerase/epimerase